MTSFTQLYSFLTTEQIFLLILLICFAWIAVFQRRHSNLPPGPTGLPIIGCLFSLGRVPYKTFKKWGQTYGDIFSVRLGTELVVVLNSHTAMKEALVKQSHTFSLRPTNSATARLLNNKGLLDAPFPDWQGLRKFSIRSLHEYGMGRNLTEGRILDENDYLIRKLREHLDKPIDLRHLFTNAVSNILCAMLFGHRFDYDDKNFKRLLTLINNVARDLNSSSVLTFIPMLWHLPLPMKRGLEASVNSVMDYVKMKVDENREEIKDKTEGECFIDSYLLKVKEYQEKKHNDNDKSLSFLEDPGHLASTCFILFAAGTDTTANSLLWAVLYLCLHPDVQANCFQEIDNKIGSGTIPSMSDKSKLPYIEATTLEVQRIASIVPLGVPHMTSESVSIRGYCIPKNTMVMTNIWGVHMDEREWNDPNKFDPGRFLDESGNVVNRNTIVPFSMGSRDCLGSELAKMEFFLFLTLLLQKFKFELPEDDSPSTDGTVGIINMPKPFSVIIRERDNVYRRGEP
ncbi:cytochrome P450 2U1-like [Glandiceps talaboti]